MRIVFHGANAAAFAAGFGDMLQGGGDDIALLPDTLDAPGERETYAAAEVVIGTRFDATLPRPEGLRLFHVPGAGFDAVDLNALPAATVVCNCFGHEDAIAEYVMAALLRRCVPLDDADRRLRRGDWAWWAGDVARVHGEIHGQAIGLLGFGHIGQAVARRAKAFGMRVHVANRSPVQDALVDKAQRLDDLPEFCRALDVLVVTVPLLPQTTGLVGAAEIAALPPGALLVNVARGPVVDEQALYDALAARRIEAAIDTWYRYPNAADPAPLPSRLPFHALPNLLMTPHMSGWTGGTIRRRQRSMADNILRLARGEACRDQVR
jgi:phosphoglycerate dehydrogenase-like enzyme